MFKIIISLLIFDIFLLFAQKQTTNNDHKFDTSKHGFSLDLKNTWVNLTYSSEDQLNNETSSSSLSNDDITLEKEQFCGYSLKPIDKIVGGDPIPITETPWIVSLQINGQHYCAGAIIAQHFILTAAHCLIFSPSEITLIAGSSTTKPSQYSLELKAKQIYKHTNYNPNTIVNDIGLIYFSENISFASENPILPVCLPENYSQSTGLAKVAGYGRTSETSPTSQVLRSIEVPLIDDETCSKSYGRLKIVKSMICAGFPEGGKDACQGDSGGPMTLDGKIIGIVSWGIGCARPNKPGVYTQVSYFIDWIEESMKDLEEKAKYNL